MRNLTIKRTKSFVGSLCKVKVYIEDENSEDLVINGIPCRKLGELKNGEEKSFSVDEKGAKVFVICDKATKEYCNDFYNIPEGEEDIFLIGKNKFNPAAGNAFRFDGTADEESTKNRKKGTVIGLFVLLAAIIIGGVSGYFISTALTSNVTYDDKTFDSNGMKITLTEAFTETEYEAFTASYSSSDVSVFALREDFSLIENFGQYTLEEYGEAVLKSNSLDSSDIKNDGSLTYFEYEYEDAADTYSYLSFVFKGPDAFWIIQFSTYKEKYEEYRDAFFEWARTIEFTGETI